MKEANTVSEAVEAITGPRVYSEKQVDKLPLTPFQLALKRARQPRNATKALDRISRMTGLTSAVAEAQRTIQVALNKEAEIRAEELTVEIMISKDSAREAMIRLI